MEEVKHLTREELEAGRRPHPPGLRRRTTEVLMLIVGRPQINERRVLQNAELDPQVGLVGDSWRDTGEYPERLTVRRTLTCRSTS